MTMSVQRGSSQPSFGGRPQTILALRPVTGDILQPEPPLISPFELSIVDNQFAALLMLPEVQPTALLIPADAAASARTDFLKAVLTWTDLPVIVGVMPDATDEFITEAVIVGVKHFIYLPSSLSAILAELGEQLSTRDSVLRIGEVELDEAGLTIRYGPRRIQLSVQLFALLYRLSVTSPQVVALRELHADFNYTVDALRMMISRLRDTLASEKLPLAIDTVRGRGYRLMVTSPL